MERATALKNQLKQDGANEYTIKTVDVVFGENYNQANNLLKSILQ
jgi:hypothetical protein